MFAKLDESKNVIPCDSDDDAYKALRADNQMALDFIGDHCVSTIFLCVEHWGGAWFESYVFPANGKEITDYSEVAGRRARTYEEVMQYHKAYADQLRAGIVPSYSDSHS